MVAATSVTLSRRKTSTGSFFPVRTAVYEYYTGVGSDSDHGRLGDLKLVTIREGTSSGSIIDQKYYRYYKQFGYSIAQAPYSSFEWGGTNNSYPPWGTDPIYPQDADNSVVSGIRLVVEGESFSRMAANYASYATQSDETLKPFAINHYTYETLGRLQLEFRSLWFNGVHGDEPSLYAVSSDFRSLARRRMQYVHRRPGRVRIRVPRESCNDRHGKRQLRTEHLANEDHRVSARHNTRRSLG